jgi:hypothetical protein
MTAHASVTKVEANYVDHPVAGQRCGRCTMFLADRRACTLVKGDIDPMAHCQFFEAKKVRTAKLFADVMKEEPGVTDGHVATAIGNSKDRPRKWKPFSAVISGWTPAVNMPRRGKGKPQSTFGPTPVETATTKRATIEERIAWLHARRGDRIADTVGKKYATVADLPATVRGKLKGKKLRQWMHVFNSTYDTHADLPTAERESRSFAGAWSVVGKVAPIDDAPLVGLKNRRLEPYDENTYHLPFRYSPAALNVMRPDQTPRFLDAVTHPDRLPLTNVPLDSLYGIQDRIGRDVVQQKLDELRGDEPQKLPVVVRIAGANHIADGHDRLAARWLNGDETADVRYEDLDPVSEAKPDPTDAHSGSNFDLLQPTNGRRLTWQPNGTLAPPFVFDPTFLGGLREDQVPRFFDAITHQDDVQNVCKVPLDELRAIQDRVNPDTVSAHIENPSKKLPVVVRAHGVNYIADGHDRLTARWLRGKNKAKVRHVNLGDVPSPAVKRDDWEIPFQLRKADPDKRQVFGWASVVTKNGQPIIDKQGDIIPVEELEKAFYDYVLFSRDQGHMHSQMGVGRLIECMVFTRQKQDVLKIQITDEAGNHIEGAWVGYQVDDPSVWAAYKRGDLPEFSIGGAAVPVEVNVEV